ncbi:MAG: Asp-tRNA(Asn)/Glu-tRNA(Gln) amidotransferase subunit GatA [Bacillota bacterium]
MDYNKLSVKEIAEKIASRDLKSYDVVRYFVQKCEENMALNAVVEIFYDSLDRAKEIDAQLDSGKKLGALAGVPIAIKDNILYTGHKASCGSAFLVDFVAPYSATIVEKLLNAGAVIIGRTNMDEFAMGGSTENSIHGVCHNAVNNNHVAGGSSGGSAVAVAAGLVPCAIGTDTGGSIRQPASFNGVVGIKPTYGTVSRYGIVAYASSLDQASPIAKSVSDCRYVLEILAGKDVNDGTTIVNPLDSIKKDTIKLGVCKQIMDAYKAMPQYSDFMAGVERLKERCEIVEVDMPHITNTLACYYIIAPAEATSNLARFDGIKYTARSEKARDLESVYIESRTEGFGKEVKRRIMLGNYVLSSGYFDAYYNKAKSVQKLIRKEFDTVFNTCDALVLPTTPGEAFAIGEKIGDPIAMYMEDLFTVPANIAGVPAISIPYGVGAKGLPLGMQFMAMRGNDGMLCDIAAECAKFVKGEAYVK